MDSDLESTSSSDTNFAGFNQYDVHQTEQNLDIVPNSEDSMSDIDIDVEFENYSSDSSSNDQDNTGHADHTNNPQVGIEDLQNSPGVNIYDESDSDGDDIVGNPSGLSDIDLYDSCDKPIKWTQNFKDIELHEFSGVSGPMLPDNFDVSSATPKDYFSLFITEEILETITRNTNLYQEFAVERKRVTDPNYNDKFWTKPVDLPEMKAYLGLSILMGLVQVPTFKCYWSTCSFLGNQ